MAIFKSCGWDCLACKHYGSTQCDYPCYGENFYPHDRCRIQLMIDAKHHPTWDRSLDDCELEILKSYLKEDKPIAKTNFDKLIEGGPEALINYSMGTICSHCAFRVAGCTGSHNSPCARGKLEWLKSPAKPTLSDKEREIANALIVLDVPWIARDKSGKIYAYKTKPCRLGKQGYTFMGDSEGKTFLYAGLDENLFAWLTWEDDPVDLRELVK